MAPIPPHDIPIPTFSLQIDDLSHPGALIFIKYVNALDALQIAVSATCTWLYTVNTIPTNVQKIHLRLSLMDGVARTSGTHSEKWIEFSLHYIEKVADRVQEEVLGVLVHEVVHCYQFNGKGACPGGLIEGIADYVRLRAGLAPPHWRDSPGDKWDSGYENTAYFLAWIEERHGDGTVQKLNFCLKEREYHKSIFVHLTGESVEKLWKAYREQVKPVGKLAAIGKTLVCNLF